MAIKAHGTVPKLKRKKTIQLLATVMLPRSRPILGASHPEERRQRHTGQPDMRKVATFCGVQ